MNDKPAGIPVNRVIEVTRETRIQSYMIIGMSRSDAVGLVDARMKRTMEFRQKRTEETEA